jgi:TPR repeat protein
VQATAKKWWQKAADQKDGEAQYHLGTLYDETHGFKDPSKAVLMFKAAADQGHVKAQFNLGCIFEDGITVKANLETASMWYQVLLIDCTINRLYY